MKNEKLEKEVYDFVFKHLGSSFKDLESNIADPDLYSLVSEDAIYFMEDFSEIFDVNLEGFVITEYFLFLHYKWYDYLIGLEYIYKLIYKKKPYDDVVLKPLTLKHLVAVAKAKKWIDFDDL